MTDTKDNQEQPAKPEVIGGKQGLEGLVVAQNKALGFLDRHQSRNEVMCRAGSMHDREGWVFDIGVTAVRTKRNVMDKELE